MRHSEYDRETSRLRMTHLEYAYSIWNPYHIQTIKALEQIQMRATNVPSTLTINLTRNVHKYLLKSVVSK